MTKNIFGSTNVVLVFACPTIAKTIVEDYKAFKEWPYRSEILDIA